MATGRYPKGFNSQQRSNVAPSSFKCRIGGEWKPSSGFSSAQLAKWHQKRGQDGINPITIGLTCLEHAQGFGREKKCGGPCGKKLQKERFSKNQRNREDAWCIACTDWKGEVETTEIPPPAPNTQISPDEMSGDIVVVGEDEDEHNLEEEKPVEDLPYSESDSEEEEEDYGGLKAYMDADTDVEDNDDGVHTADAFSLDTFSVTQSRNASGRIEDGDDDDDDDDDDDTGLFPTRDSSMNMQALQSDLNSLSGYRNVALRGSRVISGSTTGSASGSVSTAIRRPMTPRDEPAREDVRRQTAGGNPGPSAWLPPHLRHGGSSVGGRSQQHSAQGHGSRLSVASSDSRDGLENLSSRSVSASDATSAARPPQAYTAYNPSGGAVQRTTATATETLRNINALPPKPHTGLPQNLDAMAPPPQATEKKKQNPNFPKGDTRKIFRAAQGTAFRSVEYVPEPEIRVEDSDSSDEN
ncbi:Uu.00g072170.m01.CDS01 [Anthostomella pinea]|uniref:Uu.00g072170.m01.CDS01 n=1 Tax=Anthostomella pinea TaxID=933095 RepID=A0AAI8VV03_9PEZI|nr:Uu.00g072170.m01.CDS01 [Anthostomella pinea]